MFVIIMYIIKYDSYNYLILWGGFSRYQSDWAKQVSIPTRFTTETTSALKNKVTTQKACDEIINLYIHYVQHQMITIWCAKDL